QTMGALAPAMGLIGTLIGLVRMLEHLEDPAQIGPGMALALLTTFYGAILAHLILLPLAGKLRARSEEERLIKTMTVEGVTAISEGINPRLLEARLQSFLPPEQRISRYE
ncbi:MAG: MotA/TolQ/ExbB proton channel family protein, partial [Bdellovibrionales bacterium]|nr:MotA/TolQ/ExbB proton channel family protein [Bdellovibrionales bacterium]